MPPCPPARLACDRPTLAPAALLIFVLSAACGGGSGAGTPRLPPGGPGSGGDGAGGGGSGGAPGAPPADAAPPASGGAAGSAPPPPGPPDGGGAGGGGGSSDARGDAAATPDGPPADTGPPPLPEFPLAAVRAARAERVAAVGTHVEGPSWRDGELFFASDGNGLMRIGADGRLHRYHPRLAPVGSYRLADGSLLVCDKQHIVVQLFRDGKVGVIVGDGAGPGFCNDVTVDGEGNIYFTDARGGAIYRVLPTGELTRVVGGRGYPNGLEVDPASKYLYFSTAGGLWRIALPAPGSSGGFPAPQDAGGPGSDGMAFDAWGNLWLARVSTGRLAVFDPVRRQVIVEISAGGPEVTNLTFGGPADDVVYTTLSGRGVWRIPVGARGFLHPGAPKYAIKRMLDLIPVAD